jgi:hypothetical protein
LKPFAKNDSRTPPLLEHQRRRDRREGAPVHAGFSPDNDPLLEIA